MDRRTFAVPLFLLALLAMFFTLDAAPAAAKGGDPLISVADVGDWSPETLSVESDGTFLAQDPVLRGDAAHLPRSACARCTPPELAMPDETAMPRLDSRLDRLRSPPAELRLRSYGGGETERRSSPYAKRAKRAT